MKTQGNDLVSLGQRPLTKREYFAVMILAGIASKPEFIGIAAARNAVTLANLLIKELNKENNGKDN